jgi:hypothetical protein
MGQTDDSRRIAQPVHGDDVSNMRIWLDRDAQLPDVLGLRVQLEGCCDSYH